MRRTKGFHLLELLVVVLIMGTLVAVALPHVTKAALQAQESALKRDLIVVRDAIEMYAERFGFPPGPDSRSSPEALEEGQDLMKRIPLAPLGPKEGTKGIRVVGDGEPLMGVANPLRAWKYDYKTGEFIFNYNGVSRDGVTTYDEF